MLLTKEVEVKMRNLKSKTIKNYKDKGYNITDDKIMVKVEDLPEYSRVEVKVLCDYCLDEIVKQYQAYLEQNKKSTIKKDCCKKCVAKKIKESNLLKYGAESTSELDEVKNKYRNTNKEKYGVENYSQTEEYKNKVKDTCIKKYGVENVFQDELIKEKIKKSNLEKYGVESYTQTEEYKSKSKFTHMKKYGVEHYNKTEEYKNKVINTNLNKYGVKNVMHNDEIKNKLKETMLSKYGVENIGQTDLHREKCKQTSLKNFGVEYAFQSDEVKEKIKKTNVERYGFEVALQNPIIKAKQIKTLYNNGNCKTSTQQNRIYDILLDEGYDVKLNYPIKNLNLDIALFLDDYYIDIEYDGWYWHKNILHKDRARDEVLKSKGWKILRIRGGIKIPNLEEIIYSLNELIYSDREFIQIILDEWRNNVNKEAQ